MSGKRPSFHNGFHHHAIASEAKTGDAWQPQRTTQPMALGHAMAMPWLQVAWANFLEKSGKTWWFYQLKNAVEKFPQKRDMATTHIGESIAVGSEERNLHLKNHSPNKDFWKNHQLCRSMSHLCHTYVTFLWSHHPSIIPILPVSFRYDPQAFRLAKAVSLNSSGPRDSDLRRDAA